MPQYTAQVVNEVNGPFKAVQKDIPEPGENQVLLEVKACGICAGDEHARAGHMGCQFPRCHGHEVAGTVRKVGPGARTSNWKQGDRAGVGWAGKWCFTCEACREGDFTLCENLQITGFQRDGGYQEYMLADVDALARVPEGIEWTQAAPLMCAGLTVFNALRRNPRKAGSLVAIQGIGGLGHLGIQFANKLGYRVVAISRGEAKRSMALEMGAHHYIDSTACNPAEELKKLGGAKIILATGKGADGMTQLIDGLGRRGVMVVVGADIHPIKITPIQLISGSIGIQGHASGYARDAQDTLEFAALHGIKVQTEEYSLDQVDEAFEAMRNGKYRVVLKIGQ